MPKKTREYRSKDDLQNLIILFLQGSQGSSRLEIARGLGMSKSPNLINAIRELVICYNLIEVKRWYLNRMRYEMVYFVMPPIDHAAIMNSKEDKAIAARQIYAEYYIEANGGLLGHWDFKESHKACTCQYDSPIIIRHKGECWSECMTCGKQEKALWHEV